MSEPNVEKSGATPEKQLAEALKPHIKELVKGPGVRDLVKQFAAKSKEGAPDSEVRKRLSEAIVKMPEIVDIVKPPSKTPEPVLKTPEPVLKTPPKPVLKTPQPSSSADLADVIMTSKSISRPSKERFAKLSEAGQLKVTDFVKTLADPIPDWKISKKLGEVESQEPAYVEAQKAQLEKQKQPTLSGEKEASDQRARSIGVQVGESNTRARKQKEAAEKDTSLLGETINKALAFADIAAGKEYSFRAISKQFTPWRVRKEGFTRNPKNKVGMTVLQIVEALYCDFVDGAAEYMALYRGGTANNDSRLNLPFISAGPLISESQGASGSDWQYAVRTSGVTEMSIDTIESELSRIVRHKDKLGDLKLLTNGSLGGADRALLKHGPMGEETWITAVPADCVIAFTCLNGDDWMQRWTFMKDADAYLQICKKTLGGEKIVSM